MNEFGTIHRLDCEKPPGCDSKCPECKCCIHDPRRRIQRRNRRMRMRRRRRRRRRKKSRMRTRGG